MLPEQRPPVPPVGERRQLGGREEKRNKPREPRGGERDRKKEKRQQRSEEDANAPWRRGERCGMPRILA